MLITDFKTYGVIDISMIIYIVVCICKHFYGVRFAVFMPFTLIYSISF